MELAGAGALGLVLWMFPGLDPVRDFSPCASRVKSDRGFLPIPAPGPHRQNIFKRRGKSRFYFGIEAGAGSIFQPVSFSMGSSCVPLA